MQLRERQLADDSEKSVRRQISIIVPVFNEAALIRPFLQHLRERAPGAEIIVADGGSSDGTDQLAAGFCDRLVASDRGRARQMNTGARAARGEILWFVHVDAKLPLQCLDEIAHIMDDPNVAGGYFRIRLPLRPGLSTHGRLCSLRGHSAANAMRRSRHFLPAKCLSRYRRISRGAIDGRRRIFSPAPPLWSCEVQSSGGSW